MSKRSGSARVLLCAALAVLLFSVFSFPSCAAPVAESGTGGISFPSSTVFFPSGSDYVYISDSTPLKFNKRHYGHFLAAFSFQAGGIFVGNTSGYSFQGNFYIECNGVRYYFYPSFSGGGTSYLEFALDLSDQNTVSVGYEGYVARTGSSSSSSSFTYTMNLRFDYVLYDEGQAPTQLLTSIVSGIDDVESVIVSGVNNLYNMGGAIAAKLDGVNNAIDKGLGTVNSSIIKSGSDIVSALSGLSGIGSGVSSGNQLLQQGNQLQGETNSLLKEGNEIAQQGNELQQQGNQLQEQGNTLAQQGNQLQQQTNEKLDNLTDGYDSSDADAVNKRFHDSFTDFDVAEEAVFNDAMGHINDLDLESYFIFSEDLMAALSFVKTVSESFMMRSGAFGSIVPFVYALILVTLVLGIWRFRR